MSKQGSEMDPCGTPEFKHMNVKWIQKCKQKTAHRSDSTEPVVVEASLKLVIIR